MLMEGVHYDQLSMGQEWASPCAASPSSRPLLSQGRSLGSTSPLCHSFSCFP